MQGLSQKLSNNREYIHAQYSNDDTSKDEWVKRNEQLVYECLNLLERGLGSFDILTRAQLTGALAPTHTLSAQPAMPAEGFIFDSGISLSRCYSPNSFAAYISSCFNYLISKLTICEDHLSFKVKKSDLKRTWFIMWASGHGWRCTDLEMPSLYEYEHLGYRSTFQTIVCFFGKMQERKMSKTLPSHLVEIFFNNSSTICS